MNYHIEYVKGNNPHALMFEDKFDDCAVGLTIEFGLIYSLKDMMNIIMEEKGCGRFGAIDEINEKLKVLKREVEKDWVLIAPTIMNDVNPASPGFKGKKIKENSAFLYYGT